MITLTDNLSFQGTSSGTSVHLNNVSNGELSVVMIACNQSNQPNRVASVTDSKNNVYIRAQGVPGTSVSTELWYAVNATLDNLTTVSVTLSSGDIFDAIWATFSGVATTSPFDNSAATAGTSATSATTALNLPTRMANTLLIGWAGQANNRPMSTSTGFTNVSQTSNGSTVEVMMEYQVLSATATPSVTTSWDLASNYTFGVAAFADTDITTGTYVSESMAAAPTTGTNTNISSSNGWQSTGDFLLNNNVNQNDDFEYTALLPSIFTAKVDMQMASTSGADGSWFYYGANVRPQTEGDAIGGYLINRNDFGNAIEIRFNGAVLTSVAYTKDTNYDTLQIDVNGQAFTITYMGAVVLTYTDTVTRTLAGHQYGWGARSGGTANTHTIKNLSLVAGSSVATDAIAAAIVGQSTVSGAINNATVLAAAMSGSSTMGDAPTDTSPLAATIAGNGSINVTLSAAELIAAVISGTSTMTASIVDADTLVVNIPGLSTVHAAPVDNTTIAGASTGGGAMAANIANVENLLVAATGAGTMAVVLSDRDALAAVISGIGSMAAGITNIEGVSAPMYGSNTTTASLADIIAITASMAGASTMNANNTGADYLAAAIGGGSATTAALNVAEYISASINGIGSMNNPAVGQLGYMAFIITGSGAMSATIADKVYSPNYGSLSLRAEDGSITYMRNSDDPTALYMRGGIDVSVTLIQQ